MQVLKNVNGWRTTTDANLICRQCLGLTIYQVTPSCIQNFVYITKIYLYSAACKPGYFGKTCDEPCPLGLYGDNCGGRCFPLCLNENCNHIHGCHQNTISPVQTTNKSICFRI